MPKKMTIAERAERKILLDRIKLDAEDNSAMLTIDNPNFGKCEAAFRRGFREALIYLLLFTDLTSGDRRIISDYLKRVTKWKNALVETGSPAYPPIPSGKRAEAVLRSGVKPNPRKKP